MTPHDYDRAKRAIEHNILLGGRREYRCSQAQLANRRAAIAFALAAIGCFAGSMFADQPILALAAFIFLVAAAIVARYA